MRISDWSSDVCSSDLLAFAGIGLALLVEGHDHGRRAVAQHRPGLLAECGLAFLHRDRVDHALDLQALEAGLDHAPLRRVDHSRDAGDVGLRRSEEQTTDSQSIKRVTYACFYYKKTKQSQQKD